MLILNLTFLYGTIYLYLLCRKYTFPMAGSRRNFYLINSFPFNYVFTKRFNGNAFDTGFLQFYIIITIIKRPNNSGIHQNNRLIASTTIMRDDNN